jgi:NitT/TauT family transport system substrate-binding protein
MSIEQSRRRFLGQLGMAGVVGMGGLAAAGLGGSTSSLAAEPPPEITTIRLEKDLVTCIAPQAAEELMRAEGFTDIRYVALTEAHLDRALTANSGFIADMIAHDEVDIGRDFAPDHILGMDAGARMTILAGLHLGCFDVIAKDDIGRVADLKGRTVGVQYGAYGDMMLLRIMAGLVGLDSSRDIRWILASGPRENPLDLFAAGTIDAFLATPPLLQEVRARNIGHVILSSITDQPWSKYYCCFLGISTGFVRKYPVATKRVLRAILKATDLCVSQPERMAQLLVEQGYTTRLDFALQALKEIRYDVWRDYDHEDSLLFYALRLHEAGLIKSNPQKLIADHTDWHFLNEIKRKLKT